MLSGRLNLKLRERKGWTYGASSTLLATRGPSLMITSALVRTELTGRALAEISRELTAPVGEQPITAAELRRAVAYLRLSASAGCETNKQIADMIRESATLGRNEDFHNATIGALASLAPADARKAWQAIVGGPGPTWLVIGDLATILPGLRKLKIAPIQRLARDFV